MRQTEHVYARCAEQSARSHVLLVRCDAAAEEADVALRAALLPGWRLCLAGAPLSCWPAGQRHASRWEYISPLGTAPLLQVLVETLAETEVIAHAHEADGGMRECGSTRVVVLRFTVADKSGAAIPRLAAERAVADFMAEVPSWWEMPRPVCPRCGCDRFREDQIVAERQRIEWDEQMGAYVYTDTSFQEVQQAENLECAQCDLALPLDYLREWT